MAVNKKALYRRAARHCAQTAEEARDAIGHFAVPTFPIRWDDPNQVETAAVLLERSRHLNVLDDDDGDAARPRTAITKPGGTGVSAKATSSKKAKKAKKLSARQKNLAKLVGLNESKTSAKLHLNTSKNLEIAKHSENIAPHGEATTGNTESGPINDTLAATPAVPRKVKIILRVPKRTFESCDADTESTPATRKRCRIILRITKT